MEVLAKMDVQGSENNFNYLVTKGLLDLEASSELLASQEQICRGHYVAVDRGIQTRLLADRKAIDQALLHTDPRVRGVAVILLKNYWLLTSETAQSAKCFVFSDPSSCVQGVAVVTILRAQNFIEPQTKDFAPQFCAVPAKDRFIKNEKP